MKKKCHLTALLDQRRGGDDGSVVAQARRRRSVTGGFGLKNSEANGERCEEEEDETSMNAPLYTNPRIRSQMKTQVKP